MTGQQNDRRLEAALAQDADGLAPVDIWKPHIHDDEIDLASLGSLHTLGAILRSDRLEFLVQRELFHQRLAQFRVIVNDQNPTDVGHRGLWQGLLVQVRHLQLSRWPTQRASEVLASK